MPSFTQCASYADHRLLGSPAGSVDDPASGDHAGAHMWDALRLRLVSVDEGGLAVGTGVPVGSPFDLAIWLAATAIGCFLGRQGALSDRSRGSDRIDANRREVTSTPSRRQRSWRWCTAVGEELRMRGRRAVHRESWRSGGVEVVD